MKSPEAIICTNPIRLAEAEGLAKKLNLPLLDPEQGQIFLGLSLIVGQHLEIHDPDIGKPLSIDLATPSLLSRIQSGKKQPLGRACGLHKQKGLKVLDCTAGMGQDTITLAALGADVTVLERNPFVHLLLTDAMKSTDLPPVVAQAIQNCEPPVNCDAKSFLANTVDPQWDVIYIDPMFSGYKRNALPKKSMQIFSGICGPDDDASELLTLALVQAKRRVVVKRGSQAPLLSDQPPDHQIKGNRMRFDIYFTASLQAAASTEC